MSAKSRCKLARSFATAGRGLGPTLVVALLFTATLAPAAEPLAGTKPLTLAGDIAAHLLDGAHKFVDREIERSGERRTLRWEGKIPPPKPILSPPIGGSTGPLPERDDLGEQRSRLSTYLGVAYGSRHRQSPAFEDRAVIKDLEGVQVRQIEWDVDQAPESGVMLNGYGIYLQPKARDSRAFVVICLDANQSLTTAWYRDAWLLANHGCHVFVPMVLDRQTSESLMLLSERKTDLTHREYIYRQAFEAGRSVAGYEVSTLLALVDHIQQSSRQPFDEPSVGKSRPFKLAVLGSKSGGQTALLAGALSKDVDTTVIADYFGDRRSMWQESTENNTWGRLDEFGDAELARLILPQRRLIIESPESGESTEIERTAPRAAPGKSIVTSRNDAERELLRVPASLRKTNLLILEAQRERNRMFADATLRAVLKNLGRVELNAKIDLPEIPNAEFVSTLDNDTLDEIQLRLVRETAAYTQALIRESEYVRKDFMKDADRKSRDPAKWHASVDKYRKYFYDEVIGRFEHDLKPFNAQTRQVYDTDKYRGYEVTLDVFDDVIAYGVLLVPKDIKPGERRSVVVCQHGLEGRPQDTIEKDIPGERYYHQFAAKLAERGFVTFAPQNLYIFKDRFRELQRKLNPLKKTLFSLIVPQHEQICRWLKTQPFVDGSRIGFYGLSYGGKTAMRVPPLVDHYSCVICSGDFNDWIRKCTSIRDPFSYVGTGEYEIWEWNLANTFNYAEMAGLICPRPFMVERGHRDGVGIDEWVDYEYAKVRLLYVDLKIPERTEIEHFDGPHEINGVGSYKFLHKHLNWPEPATTTDRN
ncbi:MAG: dienelactone hydrolase family protein [Planctomycetaceae bacterium]|nr:dienelactone hydrolase family protein [Planctomycetaceae bacterium]